jgi:NADH-quinone oxidoreductase subunit C
MNAPEEIRVPASEVFETLKKLKEEGYNVLVDFTAVDYSAYGKLGDNSDSWKRAHPLQQETLLRPIASAEGEEYGTPHSPGKDSLDEPRPAAPVSERFDVVYRLMKLDPKTGDDLGRIYVRCGVPENPPILRSAMSLWPIADWLEREVWDMFGIAFVDRPDIKRLLLYEEFKGHPLRKDYPITKRQPLIGPPSGDRENSPSFNIIRPTVKYD